MGGVPLRRAREIAPLIIDPPVNSDGIELAFRGDSKTVVDWINGKGRMKKPFRIIDEVQLMLMDWWMKGINLCCQTGSWATHVFREHNVDADKWAGYGVVGREDE